MNQALYLTGLWKTGTYRVIYQLCDEHDNILAEDCINYIINRKKISKNYSLKSFFETTGAISKTISCVVVV